MARLAGAGTSSPSWPGRGSGWPSPRDPGSAVPSGSDAGCPSRRRRRPRWPVAGAAAQVALEVPRQVGLLLVVEGGRRHHHAGRAETALEALPVQELLLHRMECGAVRARSGGGAGGSQTFHGGDGAALGADRGIDAAVHRHAVHVHRAGAAVAGVAALLHAEVALLAQERPQALAGPGFGLRRAPLISLAVVSSISMAMLRPLPSGGPVLGPASARAEGSASGAGPAAARSHRIRAADRVPAGAVSSARISSASRYVMSLRQAGRPWTSSW